VAPLPLIKIAAVLFKEVSKPIAGAIRHQAHARPRFRAAAVALGRAWEAAGQHAEAALAGRRLAAARPVSEANAFATGTELVTQGVLLAAALSFVLFEYVRSVEAKDAETLDKAVKKAARQAVKEARLVELERSVADAAARAAVAELALEALLARSPPLPPPPPPRG